MEGQGNTFQSIHVHSEADLPTMAAWDVGGRGEIFEIRGHEKASQHAAVLYERFFETGAQHSPNVGRDGSGGTHDHAQGWKKTCVQEDVGLQPGSRNSDHALRYLGGRSATFENRNLARRIHLPRRSAPGMFE